MKCENSGYAILTDDQVKEIHERSLDLLEQVGIWVRSQRGLDILQSAGCKR